MKHISTFALSISLLTITFVPSTAQDILKFKNGDELKVKVQEITPEEIKYKRFDNPNGPLITILKNTATSIQYENGTTEKLTEEVPTNAHVSPTQTSPIGNLSNENGFEVGDIVEANYYGTVYRGKVMEINQRKLRATVDLNKNGFTRRIWRPFSELTLIEKGTLITGFAKGGSHEDVLRGQSDARKYYEGYKGAGTGTFVTAMLLGPVIGLIPAAACSSTPSSYDRLTLPNKKLTQNMSYYSGYTEEAQRIKSKKVWGSFAAGSVVSILASVIIISSYNK